MTKQEAKSILNEYRNRNYNSTFRDELELANAIDTILPKYVKLEKRDTPMKLTEDTSHVIRQHNCQICNGVLDIPQLREVNFCPKCGQRIDWEE